MSEAWTRAELRPLPELSELAQGEWEGLTHDEVRQRYGRELDGWRRDPLHHHAPGGESLLQALERARRARRIIWAHMAVAGTVTGASGRSGDGPSEPAEPAEPVLGYERGRSRSLASAVASTPWALVVAHDGILRLLLLDALDLPVSAYWSVPFQLASVTVLDVSSDLVRLRGHNIAEGFLGADPAPRR
jgi:broad specificity phosphatase PhoE